jgi:hypothetical protein
MQRGAAAHDAVGTAGVPLDGPLTRRSTVDARRVRGRKPGRLNAFLRGHVDDIAAPSDLNQLGPVRGLELVEPRDSHGPEDVTSHCPRHRLAATALERREIGCVPALVLGVTAEAGIEWVGPAGADDADDVVAVRSSSRSVHA